MVVPRGGPPRGSDELVPQSDDLDLFARVERLVGEEDALLRIPALERTRGQHDRLHAIGAELDRVLDALRRRAQRVAPGES